MSVRKRGGRARKEGRRVGRGIALAALLLILGLVLGGAAALKLADQPFVQRVFNTAPKTAPKTTVKTVTVRAETTPASCVTAIEALRGTVAGLAGARQRLMQGDVARTSGDQTTAARAYSDVDTALRTVEVETAKDQLRAAVEDCKSKAALAATAPPTGGPPATQSPVSPSPSQ
ncbi:MAG TPA: hypothetical protein VII47_02450 [Actinomycetota bacterium]|jgi:hypothetical protein